MNATKHILDDIINSLPDEEELETPAIAQKQPQEPSDGKSCGMHPLIGFPERHKRLKATHGENWQAAYLRAIEIAESGGIIVCFGKRGTGKTQIAYHVAKSASFPDPHTPKRSWTYSTRPEFRAAIYSKAMDIFIELKNGYGRPQEASEKQVIERFVEAVFLVIDEAHVRGETKYEDDKLTHIIDKRYDAMRPTMLITNLEKRDFAATLSPSILSRIAEIGGGIECNWNSYRTNKP